MITQLHSKSIAEAAAQQASVNSSARRRGGFTLIEVLIVIAIIGILAGLLIPAVMFARKTIIQNSMAFEVEALGNAVEQFRNKYDVYPPDGSNRAAFERAMRKAFPQIAATEFTALYSVSNASNGLPAVLTVMDPSEALVFCLGGFSTSPTNPFTGPGGPLVAGTSATWQYNVDRTDPLFEFKQDLLSVTVTAGGDTISNDEGVLFGAAGANDALPVYTPSGMQAPFVYFNSVTYASNVPTPGGGTTRFYNFYNPSAINGIARPYKSGEVNTSVTPSTATSVAAQTSNDRHFQYANHRSFQLIGAGLDDSYGGVVGASAFEPPVFFSMKTGQSLTFPPSANPGFVNFIEAQSVPSEQLDNVSNFSDGTFESFLATQQP